jgi:sugar-specific transcriptional regulator TrmB
MVKTSKNITQTDGKLPTPPVEPPVDPCLEIEKKSQELERKNLELTNEIKELAGKNADLIERYNGVILERQELISKLSQCNIDLEQSRKNFIEKIKNWIGDLLEAVTRGS